MCTVPAQIFCAPTRAALIAAARFIPGVCGVLVSSWLALITRTPLCRQSIVPGDGAAWSWLWLTELLLRRGPMGLSRASRARREPLITRMRYRADRKARDSVIQFTDRQRHSRYPAVKMGRPAMEHFLADQGLRAICLHDVSEMDGRDQARMRADLWDGGIANAVVPGRRWLDLEEQDFVVLVSDFQRNRCLGLLTATERSTEREPFLLVEAAYVAPSARGRNLLQRMVAFAVLCIARYDRIPTLVAACAQGEACRRNLSDVRQHFRAASVFPRPDEAAIDLGMAGLAQRIARVIRPGARYEAG